MYKMIWRCCWRIGVVVRPYGTRMGTRLSLHPLGLEWEP